MTIKNLIETILAHGRRFGFTTEDQAGPRKALDQMAEKKFLRREELAQLPEGIPNPAIAIGLGLTPQMSPAEVLGACALHALGGLEALEALAKGLDEMASYGYRGTP